MASQPTIERILSAGGRPPKTKLADDPKVSEGAHGSHSCYKADLKPLQTQGPHKQVTEQITTRHFLSSSWYIKCHQQTAMVIYV